jgi:hypothetical protein
MARGFEIVADSLDVVAPGGTLETLHAVGGARGVSRPASVPATGEPEDPELAGALAGHGIDPSILENDWIEGDTIVATFAPVAPTETADVGPPGEGSAYVLERLVAIGNSRSMYRSPQEPTATPNDMPPLRPERSRWTISYVVANRITLTLSSGRVERAEAVGAVVGGYLDPLPEPATDAADGIGDVPGGAP